MSEIILQQSKFSSDNPRKTQEEKKWSEWGKASHGKNRQSPGGQARAAASSAVTAKHDKIQRHETYLPHQVSLKKRRSLLNKNFNCLVKYNVISLYLNNVTIL